jgi:hypothetical protein
MKNLEILQFASNWYNREHAQITYRLPVAKTTAKLGGTNVLSSRHIQYAGGPTIGALYYVAFTIDGLFSPDQIKKN